MRKNFFSGQAFLRCLICSSASMLLFCMGFLVPSVGVPALIFSPAPLALLGVRENKIWMTLGLLSASLSLWFAFDLSMSLSFLLGYGLLCFGLTLPMGKAEKGSDYFLFCVVVSMISKVLLALVNAVLNGVYMFEKLTFFDNKMYSDIMASGGQDAAQFGEALSQILPLLVPALIILSSMLDSYLNYRLCESLQRKRDAKFPPLPPFGEWRFPSSVLYVLAFAFALPFLTGENPLRVWKMAEYSLKCVLIIFFFLQGISLAWWWLLKFAAKFPLPLFLRVALIVFLSVNAYACAWVVALGFGDVCVNFRAIKIKQA